MTSEKKLIKICRILDLPEKKGVRFEIDDHDLAIFKINNEVYVISNICPHNYTSQMFNGHIDNYSISCPVHGWEFDLKTGQTLNNNSNIKTYETKIIDGYLFVKLPKKFFTW